MRPPDTMFVLFCFPYKRQPPGQSEDYIPLTAHVNMARHALLTSSAASQDGGAYHPVPVGTGYSAVLTAAPPVPRALLAPQWVL